MSGQARIETKAHAPTTVVGEWIWRFPAVLTLFSVSWGLWVPYQLNPPMPVTAAAFEAAAKARATPSAAGGIALKPQAQAPKPEPGPAAKEPPVKLERLKLPDSIALPLAQDAKRK